MKRVDFETRPSPSSTRACSVGYNYAWEYFRRERRPSLVPRPSRAPARKEGPVLTSDFLVVLSQHAYGNFVMQRDIHMTAVAHLFRLSSARCTAHTSKNEELLLIARARWSAWKDAYQQLTGRVVAGMACSTASSCSFVG